MTRSGVRPAAGVVISVLVVLLAAALLFAAAFGAVQLRPDDLLRMTLNHVVGARFDFHPYAMPQVCHELPK